MLFYWMAVALHNMGLSLGASIEATAFITILLSALFMFFFIRDLWGPVAGVFSALLYSYAPYHLVNAYVRGAYSELAAFIWFPFVIHHLYYWLRTSRPRHLLLGGVGIAGLLLTHNLMAFIFLPMAFIIPLLASKVHKELAENKYVKLLGYLTIWTLGVLLSAFFWLPILLRRGIVRLEEFLYYDYRGDFVPVRDLFIPSPGHFLTTQIGLSHVVAAGAVVVFVFILNKNARHKRLLCISTLALAICLFLTSRYSIFLWQVIPILKFVQFPWRFLAPGTFFISLIAGYLPNLFHHRNISLLSVFIMVSFAFVIHRSLISLPQEISYEEINSLKICEEVWLTQDYRPTWSDAPFWHGPKPPTPNDEQSFLGPCAGKVKVEGDQEVVLTNVSNEGVIWNITFESKGKGKLIIPQYFYPGWRASLDGNPISVFPNTEDGLLQISLIEGNHAAEVIYKQTIVDKIGNMLSILGLILIVVLIPIRAQERYIEFLKSSYWLIQGRIQK
jgi:hypothetical protein